MAGSLAIYLQLQFSKVRRIEFTEYAVFLEKQIRRLDSKTQYVVLIRRFNTSYPTGGYGVSVSNDTLLDDLDTSKEFIDRLAPLANLLKSRDEGIENLKAQLLLKEAKAAEATCLCIQVSTIEDVEKVHVDELNVLKEKSAALKGERDSLNEKITEIQSSVAISDVTDMLSLIGNLSLSPDGIDKWTWSQDNSGIFKRASINRLPTRTNLISRGVFLASVLCPFCKNEEEDIEHCLIRCPCVLPIGRKCGVGGICPPLLPTLHSLLRISPWASWLLIIVHILKRPSMEFFKVLCGRFRNGETS
ncbi:gypsy type transposase [Tanacetum coccineum]|uniref:Gypsy type transposase n=1 Tax=Tanacetum coccineum TaxID=301880 RepID=A0ABQ4X0Y2_9ASTR